MTSRRTGLRALLPVVIIAAALVGCAGSTAPTDPPTSPSPRVAATVGPTGPLALRAGALEPGTYTTTAFEPTVRFTIQDDWVGLFPDDEDEVALEGPDGVFFAITRVAKVVDPATGSAVAVPDDLVDWLASHPRLTADVPQAVTIAGLDGMSVDVIATNGSELGLFAYETGNMRVPAGVTFRCMVLPFEGSDLTFILGAPDAGLAEATEMIQPVLDSMEIDAGS